MPILLQFMKKHEYLSFFSTSFGQISHKEIKDNEIEDLECMFEFMSCFGKFILPLFELKKCQELTSLSNQLIEKMIEYKVNLLNIFGSVILKRFICSRDIDSVYYSRGENSIRKDNPMDIEVINRQQIDKYITVIQLWCKIY